MLDAVALARGPVPLREFRLLEDCVMCAWFASKPATAWWNQRIKNHIEDDHRDLIKVSSD